MCAIYSGQQLNMESKYIEIQKKENIQELWQDNSEKRFRINAPF